MSPALFGRNVNGSFIVIAWRPSIMWTSSSYNFSMETALNVSAAGGKASWDIPVDVVEFWKQAERTALMRKLILHAADVSNPFKPFPICRAWAYLVIVLPL